jgi:hypothetical protein
MDPSPTLLIPPPLIWRLGALAASLVCGFAACTAVNNAGPVPPATPDTAQAVIGAGGGTLSTPDGVLTLSVPRGAVDHDVEFTVAPTAAPLPAAVGAAFEIGPSGTQFAVPATVAIRYSNDELGDATASDLLIATIAQGKWQPLSASAVDQGSMTVAGATPHLSPYALVRAAAVALSDAGPPAEGGTPGDAEPPADVAAADTGASDAPADAAREAAPDASGCTTEETTSGACAAPPQPLCSDLQATVAISCIDSPVGAGFMVVCCPVADGGDGG